MPFIQRGTIATLRQSIHICANAKEMRPMYLLRLQQITPNTFVNNRGPTHAFWPVVFLAPASPRFGRWRANDIK
jgi:hypothetical protein